MSRDKENAEKNEIRVGFGARPVGSGVKPVPTVRVWVNPHCSAYCFRPNGRKETIQCASCNSHIHSVSCAGFSSHREAKHASFTYRKCIGRPLLQLPQISTPRVTQRIVVNQNEPATDNSTRANDFFPINASFTSCIYLPTCPRFKILAWSKKMRFCEKHEFFLCFTKSSK